MLTVPDIAGVAVNGGITKVYGASSNEQLEGWANFWGWSLSLGEFVNVGAGENYGKGKTSFVGGKDYIDPVSNQNVRYKQSFVFGELNIPIFSTPIDGSVFWGKSYTSRGISYKAPIWPFK